MVTMSEGRGCLRTGLLGCGALLALAVVGVLIMVLIAWLGMDEGGRVEEDAVPGTPPGSVETATPPHAAAVLTTRHPGRVVLDLGQGEFHLQSAEPGAGLSVHAVYDSEVHALGYSFELAPDSTWTGHVTFRQTMPGLQALFRKLMGGNTDAVIHVYLPPDVPIELVVRLEQGGAETELGGLWLRTADFDFRQGGFSLNVDEPLQEPLARLRLHGRMGGVEADRLGNASPRVLEVDCAMGGADLNLRGAWRNDCDARMSIRLGGMEVRVPADMRIEGDAAEASALRRDDLETPLPVLRLALDQKMGEIEVRH
jgi:hypothetical protein